MLHVYASVGNRLLHFSYPAAPNEGSRDDCDDVVKGWLHGALGGATLDEDGGAIFCLAVTGKPGDRYEVTVGGLPVAVVVRS